jgi:hypothetical protein
MAEASKPQFSLREVVGTVAPGAMVLLAAFYVTSRLPGLGRVGDIGSGWDALLILFVVSYGIGTLLTSLTEACFAAVTKLGTTSALSIEATTPPPRTVSERIYRSVDRVIRMAVAYLSGGNDITTGIREFRESWHTRAVPEGVVSAHTFDLASKHYRTLFNADPAGEEALLVCEYYIRERMPAAMQEIEQNAARAALLGNLIIPMVAWVAAALAGIVLAVLNGSPFAALVQLVLFTALFALFPYIVKMIGYQWREASRNRVKIILLAFIIACRLDRPTEAQSQAQGAYPVPEAPFMNPADAHAEKH